VSKLNIDFLGHRNIMFTVSGVLIALALGSIFLKGMTFGVEFQGGTVMSIVDAKGASTQEVAAAFEKAGIKNPNVQTTSEGDKNGFIVRTEVTSPKVAAADTAKVAAELGVESSAFQVTTIGPGWGKNITDRALWALGLSILAILVYVSLRFEYKMSVTAVIALVHDILITLGIYALIGYEVTPNTVAALLTILGYSLYDTIVVFHRIKENTQYLQKQSFMQMANESINEVIVRSMNTTITSMIPVLIMLFFGGETLKDFALALSIGLFVGAYSSIGVAAPIFALWKETEPKYAALRKKFANA